VANYNSVKVVKETKIRFGTNLFTSDAPEATHHSKQLAIKIFTKQTTLTPE